MNKTVLDLRTIYKKDQHQTQNSFYNVLTFFNYTYASISQHFHKSFELAIVLEGHATATVGNNTFTFEKGECMLVFPYQLHGFEVDENSRVWVATFQKEYVKAFYKPLTGKKAICPAFKLSDRTLDFVKASLIDPYGVSSFFSSISTETELLAKGCLYAICSEYIEKVELVDEKRDTESIPRNVLQYIEENFKDDISLQTAASALGYNYQYVSRIFNQSTRFNFKNVLNQYRFDYATLLLRETDMPITDVAFESGFQSLRTFNRVCHDMYNTSPKHLRSEINKRDKTGAESTVSKKTVRR